MVQLAEAYRYLHHNLYRQRCKRTWKCPIAPRPAGISCAWHVW